MCDAVGTDVLIYRPGYTTFLLQTHVFSWSFVSACADKTCHILTDHHECNNGLSIASAACSHELDHSNASNKETATPKHIVEDDAGSCFMPPNALTEHIDEQPPRSLLNNLTYHELLMFTLRTQVLRWSLVSRCGVEHTANEGCKSRHNW